MHRQSKNIETKQKSNNNLANMPISKEMEVLPLKVISNNDQQLQQTLHYTNFV